MMKRRTLQDVMVDESSSVAKPCNQEEDAASHEHPVQAPGLQAASLIEADGITAASDSVLKDFRTSYESLSDKDIA